MVPLVRQPPIELPTLQGQLFGASRSEARERAQELVQLIGLTGEVGRRVGGESPAMQPPTMKARNLFRRRARLPVVLGGEFNMLILLLAFQGRQPR